MHERVGIMVDHRVLAKAMRGQATKERVHLYRTVSLDYVGVDIVVFSIENVSIKRHVVRGYVPSKKGWRPSYVPIPRVIHKRALYSSSTPFQKLRILQRRGVVFVNPPLMNDKAKMYQLLAQEEPLTPHLPPTSPYRWHDVSRMLRDGTSVIIKPKIGSVGQGIIKVVPLSRKRVRLIQKHASALPFSSLRRVLRTRGYSHRDLVQPYIDLARFHDRPFDLRVAVQRNANGDWHVPGMVAKVACRHPFLTNVAQGGRTMPAADALRHAFSEQSVDDVEQRIRELAIKVAQVVGHSFPYAADLGLDIGVDRDGHPWLIEVNAKDQRITFYDAGMTQVFEAVYTNPVAYCKSLLDQQTSPDISSNSCTDRSCDAHGSND